MVLRESIFEMLRYSSLIASPDSPLTLRMFASESDSFRLERNTSSTRLLTLLKPAKPIIYVARFLAVDAIALLKPFCADVILLVAPVFLLICASMRFRSSTSCLRFGSLALILFSAALPSCRAFLRSFSFAPERSFITSASFFCSSRFFCTLVRMASIAFSSSFRRFFSSFSA